MLEKDITNNIMKNMRKHGAFAEKTHGGPYVRVGLPDIQACVQGRYIGIECKLPGEKPTAAQLRVIEEIRSAGGVAFVAESFLDVERELRKEGIAWQR